LVVVGRADFLGSFFDTVTVRAEGGSRGSRYPMLAALYRDGELSSEAAVAARRELAGVERELRQHPTADVVWDVDRPKMRPPWGERHRRHDHLARRLLRHGRRPVSDNCDGWRVRREHPHGQAGADRVKVDRAVAA
jgi:hypothetical protein